MSTKSDSGVSRRRFLISTSMAATVGLLAPRDLFAQDDGLGRQPGKQPQPLLSPSRNSAAT